MYVLGQLLEGVFHTETHFHWYGRWQGGVAHRARDHRMTNPCALRGKQGSAKDGLPLECPGGEGISGIELELTTVSNGDAHKTAPQCEGLHLYITPSLPGQATIRIKGTG